MKPETPLGFCAKMNKPADKFSKTIYFPTIVFQSELANADELNKNLLELIYKDQEKDNAGINRSNYVELGGWHSKTDLHKSPDYAELLERINLATDHMSEDLGYSKSHTLKVGTMWSIINPPGSANIAHIHPGCIWSGVYYIQTPKDCGNIEFIEPRTAHLMNQPKYIPKKKRPQHCWTKVFYTPKAGKMLIFPSWLYHAVHPNTSREKERKGHRVIISFNISQVKI